MIVSPLSLLIYELFACVMFVTVDAPMTSLLWWVLGGEGRC